MLLIQPERRFYFQSFSDHPKIAHLTFNLPYIVNRLGNLDKQLIELAL